MRLLLFTILIFSSLNSLSQTLKALTYNIRYATENDGENQWELRKNQVVNLLHFYEPDVFGIQEGLHQQVIHLQEQLPLYEFVGNGRADGKTGGEYSALFFRSDKFIMEQSGQFWLSETPDTPSIGWDASYKRICTYSILQFKNAEGKVLVLNTHFDHKGELAREQSATLILEKIDSLNKENLPVILMGDFNLEPESESLKLIANTLRDTYLNSEEPSFGPDGTFNGFNFCEPIGGRIDYIFVNNLFSIKKTAILNHSYNLKYPSDHFPVISFLELN